jgi:glycosyltransferase involved in cell wall biosynthesis
MLVWSAIVKNEERILPRCLDSLIPHIDGAVVVDTGSADETVALLLERFTAAGKPVELGSTEFVSFSQARNVALQLARSSSLPWTYLLLSDADMELVVDDPDWCGQLNGGPSYDVRQVAGSVAYWNRRLLHRETAGEYLCPTHEYLNVPTAGAVNGIWFKDHADGANRPEKSQRDIRLLEDMLRTETNEGLIQRAHFYLGQSYFDIKNWVKSAEHYKKRFELGGFEEERWNARLHYAHCLDNMGDRSGFLWEMLQAYSMRPQRAEVFYDLAKYFRERGENFSSLLFAEAGLRTVYPGSDLLFVNDYIYRVGLKEEFAICAYYDPVRRERGAVVCDEVALSYDASWPSRNQARCNQFWYLRPLVEHVSSFKPERIELTPPDGYAFTNPSVTVYNGQLHAIVRAVNYLISPEGRYVVRATNRDFSSASPIHTRNFLVRLGADQEVTELVLPANWPETKFKLVLGLEDSRLFEWQGRLCTLSTARELNPEGWCEMVLAPLSAIDYGPDWRKVLPKERRHEKNWMPWVDTQDNSLRFVYRLGSLVDIDGDMIFHDPPDFDADHISGGSQVVTIDGVFALAVVHEARMIPGRSTRYYQHRFVKLNLDGAVLAVSLPFVFFDKQIEFAAGLVFLPEKRQLVVSFGVRDEEAWLATMDLADVLEFFRCHGWSS